MAFERHVYFWQIFGNNVWSHCRLLVFGFVFTVMWAVYVDHCSSAVGYMCDVGGMFVQRHLPII